MSVSLAGSLFFNVSPNASRQQVLLYLLITMAPLAVLSPLVGPAVDRFRNSQRFVAAGFFVSRGVFCLVLAVTLLQVAFYPVVLLLLIASKASGIVKQTLVQTLVDDPEELVSTNARLARFSSVTAALGVVAASGVFAVAGAEWSLRVGAVLFALAGATVLRARPRSTTPRDARRRRVRRDPPPDGGRVVDRYARDPCGGRLLHLHARVHAAPVQRAGAGLRTRRRCVRHRCVPRPHGGDGAAALVQRGAADRVCRSPFPRCSPRSASSARRCRC